MINDPSDLLTLFLMNRVPYPARREIERNRENQIAWRRKNRLSDNIFRRNRERLETCEAKASQDHREGSRVDKPLDVPPFGSISEPKG